MPIFSKESLDTLRQRIDLVDVLSSHIDLKRSGASYKGLCPFHDEKSPSFMMQKGDSHYHCFGCGAHGDAIQFLISHVKLSFSDAVESLAHRFGVPLQIVESTSVDEKKGPNKFALKAALEAASQFFHFYLLHTQEGHAALQYLYQRGIDLDFIYRFRIGLAPKDHGLLRKMMHAKFISDENMGEAGLISPGREKGWRDFFQDRITFPICDASGAVIGFSARKYKEDTFGGKYINTPETPLFKKSKVLFGLNYSRKRIAKERKAIIVEGQIDALRLIAAGFNITVAGQGTAFGEGHIHELLNLGLNQVYLALDSDEAGIQATCKIGNLFQREGVEVRILRLPEGSDPDLFLRERGPEAFLELMKSSGDYLTFLIATLSRALDITSPAGKNELVQTVVQQIRTWNHPLMVHEALRKLAHLMRIPESMVGVGVDYVPNIYVKQSASIGLQKIDSERILEYDFLRWLFLGGQTAPSLVATARKNIKSEHLHILVCRSIYTACLECHSTEHGFDLIGVMSRLEDAEGQTLLSELIGKRVRCDRVEIALFETMQKILDRNWMEQREELKVRIQSAQCSDDEVLELAKKFDSLKRVSLEIIKNVG